MSKYSLDIFAAVMSANLEPHSLFLSKQDAENFIRRHNDKDGDMVYLSAFSLDTAMQSQINNLYIVEQTNGFCFHNVSYFVTLTRALSYYKEIIKTKSDNTSVFLIEMEVANKLEEDFTRSKLTLIKCSLCKDKKFTTMDKNKVYVSCFVKDLNFELARILIISDIYPSSDKVDYENETIDTSSHCPLIEFRFTLDKVNDESDIELRERCFAKMRELLIERTKGKE